MRVKNVSLNESVRLFESRGIKMLGNLNTGTIIGLDQEGYNLVTQLRAGSYTGLETLTDNQNELMDALVTNEYFSDVVNNQLNNAYLHVTDTCNLHCLGCYSFVNDRNKQQGMSFEDIKRVMKELKELGLTRLVFSGGEPFMRKDFQKICQYAKEDLAIENVTVITNGTMGYAVYEGAIPYLDEISISIDGYNENTRFIRDEGIMPKVLDTVKYLKSKIRVSLIATLHKKNIIFMKDYLKLAEELGVFLAFSILSVDKDDPQFKGYLFDDQDFEEISVAISGDQEIKLLDTPLNNLALDCKSRCGVCNQIVSIAADGTIFPCHMLHNDQYALGHISNQRIEDVLVDNEIAKLHVDDFSECKDCEFKYLCGGGCRGRSHFFSGNLTSKDGYCLLMKRHFEKTMDGIALMVQQNS